MMSDPFIYNLLQVFAYPSSELFSKKLEGFLGQAPHSILYVFLTKSIFFKKSIIYIYFKNQPPILFRLYEADLLRSNKDTNNRL